MKIKKSKVFAFATIFLIVIFISVILIYYECKNGDGNYACCDETYIINVRSKKIHQTDCGTADMISDRNRKMYLGDTEALLDKGYTFCGNCFRGND